MNQVFRHLKGIAVSWDPSGRVTDRVCERLQRVQVSVPTSSHSGETALKALSDTFSGTVRSACALVLAAPLPEKLASPLSLYEIFERYASPKRVASDALNMTPRL